MCYNMVKTLKLISMHIYIYGVCMVHVYKIK